MTTDFAGLRKLSDAERAAFEALPALPEPVRMSSDQSYLGFTADQMHERDRVVWEAARQFFATKAPAVDPLTDERIDHIADLVVKGMSDGIAGFCKSWGWRQFARAIIQDCQSALKPLQSQCLGAPGECSHNGACMYACGVDPVRLSPTAQGVTDEAADALLAEVFPRTRPTNGYRELIRRAAALAARPHPVQQVAVAAQWVTDEQIIEIRDRFQGEYFNCIEFARDLLALAAQPPAQQAAAPGDIERDAARYRWLRDVGDATWRPFALREGCSAVLVDAAIDSCIEKATT